MGCQDLARDLEVLASRRQLKKSCLGSLLKIQILQPSPIDSDLKVIENYSEINISLKFSTGF